MASPSAVSQRSLAVPSTWWAGLVGVGAAVSTATLLFFFNPQLVLGLGIDGALLWIIGAETWRP